MQVGQAKDCCPEREKGHGAHLEAVCCVFEQAAPKHEVFTPPVFGGPLAQEYVALQPEVDYPYSCSAGGLPHRDRHATASPASR